MLVQKPGDKDLAAKLCKLLNNQAMLYFINSENKKGNLLVETALSLGNKVLGPLSPELACSISNRAYFYQQSGRVKEAEEYYKKALAMREKLSGPDRDKDLARSLHNLGDFYFKHGKNQLAEEYMKKAAALHAKIFGETSDEYTWDLSNLGLMHMDDGRYGDAEEALVKVLATRRSVFPSGNLEIGRSLNNLGLLHLRQRKFKLAENEFSEALPIYEDSSNNADNDDALACAANLAQTYMEQGNLAKAELNYARVYSALVREHPLDARRKAIYEILTKIYEKLGQKDRLAELKAQETQ